MRMRRIRDYRDTNRRNKPLREAETSDWDSASLGRGEIGSWLVPEDWELGTDVSPIPQRVKIGGKCPLCQQYTVVQEGSTILSLDILYVLGGARSGFYKPCLARCSRRASTAR